MFEKPVCIFVYVCILCKMYKYGAKFAQCIFPAANETLLGHRRDGLGEGIGGID